MPPVGSKGKAPGERVIGAKPRKLKAILKLNEQYCALQI